MKSLLTNEVKRNLLIDILILVLFLIVYEVKATGVTIHEWLGIAVGLIAIIHIILHWKWLVQITKQFLSKMKTESRIKYIVDILIFIGFTTIIFTGIMMSRSFLPTFGIKVGRNHFWHEMHSVFVDLTLLFTALHFALHWKWIVNTIKQYIINPVKNIFGSKTTQQPAYINSSKTKSSNFSKIINLCGRFLLILIFSGFISFGWYTISQTVSAETNLGEYRQRIESPVENGAAMNPDKQPEGFDPNHKDHDDAQGMVVLEIIKNILIFVIVTFAVTKISNRINSKKKIIVSNGK